MTSNPLPPLDGLDLDHQHPPAAAHDSIAFGQAGLGGWLLAELIVSSTLCVAVALLRSLVKVTRHDSVAVLTIVAASASDYLSIAAHQADLASLIQRTSALVTTVKLTLAEAVTGPLAEDLRRATNAANAFTDAHHPAVAISPTGISLPHAVALTPVEDAAGTVPWADVYINSSRALAALDSAINSGLCQCNRCHQTADADEPDLIVVAGHVSFGGRPTPMGGDLAPVLTRDSTQYIKAPARTLGDLGTWIRERLPRTLSLFSPRTLLIARGGGFDDTEVVGFLDDVRPALGIAVANGWQVHLGLGHANHKFRLPRVVDHATPAVAAIALQQRLDGPPPKPGPAPRLN